MFQLYNWRRQASFFHNTFIQKKIFYTIQNFLSLHDEELQDIKHIVNITCLQSGGEVFVGLTSVTGR